MGTSGIERILVLTSSNRASGNVHTLALHIRHIYTKQCLSPLIQHPVSEICRSKIHNNVNRADLDDFNCILSIQASSQCMLWKETKQEIDQIQKPVCVGALTFWWGPIHDPVLSSKLLQDAATEKDHKIDTTKIWYVFFPRLVIRSSRHSPNKNSFFFFLFARKILPQTINGTFSSKPVTIMNLIMRANGGSPYCTEFALQCVLLHLLALWRA